MRNGKFKIAAPNTPTLLILIIIFSAALSYFLPAGEFERVIDEATRRTIIVADSFHYVDQTPVTPWKLLASIFKGLRAAGELIALIFVTGGSITMVTRSGAIDAALSRVIKKTKGKEYFFVIAAFIAFASGGASFAMSESLIAFIGVAVAASVAIGYDPVVGVAVCILGAYSGYSSSPINPYSVGVAHGITQLPLFSGLGLRSLLMVGAVIIGLFFTLRYARKVKADPSKSYVSDLSISSRNTIDTDLPFTKTHRNVLIIMLVMLAIMIYGVIRLKWYFTEICAIFTLMALLVGLVAYKGNLNRISEEFMKGASSLAYAALLMGLSRGVLVVLEEGHIMDTLVMAISLPLKNFHSVFAAWGMFIAQGIINFAIPSSSGQAVVVMPIFSAVSDVIGLTRQVAVLAFQAGDGFWNMITPTHAVLMAGLGIAGVPFGRWVKFSGPIVLAWSIWTMLILAVAVVTGWGPF